MKDLGLVYNRKLQFNDHIEYITSKSSSMLGFLFRICNDFDDLLRLKVLYYAHVRSLLEYPCIIWMLYLQKD